MQPAPCPPRSFSASASTVVEDCLCESGLYHSYAGGEYACHLCPLGTYSDSAGRSACSLCAADTYNPELGGTGAANCLACPANAASAAGSTARTDCRCHLGYAGAPGADCVACVPGEFREDASVYICTACPADAFSVDVAASSAAQCLPCRANSSSAPGSGSERACVCDPGLYDPGLHGEFAACEPCAPGTYAPAPNSSACTACAAGTVSASVGAASSSTCLACAPGSYAPGAGLTACLLCPASTFQNLSAPGHAARECTACPAHSSHAAEGVTDVLTCVCAPGFWKQRVPPGFQCRECLPGHFCPGADALVPCAFNTFSTGGLTTACTACAPQSMATANASLTSAQQCQCRQGAEGLFHESCAACAAGFFQALDQVHGGADAPAAELATQEESGATVGAPAAQPTACAPCALHTFQNATGASACRACPGNSSTASTASTQATACTCNPGFFGVSGQACAECEPNNFCPGVLGTEMNPCRPHSQTGPGARAESDCKCVPGFFAAAAGAPCTLCPEDSYCPGDLAVHACAALSASTPGADSIVDCECLPGHWRECIRSAAGAYVDNAGAACAIDYARPCVQCGANDICFNETLLHCPQHSTALPGSDDARDCVCDPGFLGVYGE